mmetsp:Transcript_74775/g.206145  ORF Transcript_74775/g.206145 Transcript_74775/m.206145 type:complete len:205 (-) Transcript_74775:593-1207(-)
MEGSAHPAERPHRGQAAGLPRFPGHVLPGGRRAHQHGGRRADHGAGSGRELGVPLHRTGGAAAWQPGAALLTRPRRPAEPHQFHAGEALRARVVGRHQCRGGALPVGLPPQGAFHGRVRAAGHRHEELPRLQRWGRAGRLEGPRVVRRQEGGGPDDGRQRHHPLRQDGRRGPRAGPGRARPGGRADHQAGSPSGEVCRVLHAQL